MACSFLFDLYHSCGIFQRPLTSLNRRKVRMKKNLSYMREGSEPGFVAHHVSSMLAVLSSLARDRDTADMLDELSLYLEHLTETQAKD